MFFINGCRIPSRKLSNRHYSVEWLRVNSFLDWVGTPNFPVNSAVEIGLYHINNFNFCDAVKCVYCREVMVQWLEDDDVHVEHAKHSPNCRKGFNIPIKYKHLTQFILDSIVNIHTNKINEYTTVNLENVKNDNYNLKVDIVNLYTKETKQLNNLTVDENYEIDVIIEDIKLHGIPEEYYLLVPEDVI